MFLLEGLADFRLKYLTNRKRSKMDKNYDYIVVGGGSAGCVVAARLAEDPSVSVLLLEAGGTNNRMLTKIPLAWNPISNAKSFGWGFKSEQHENLDGRTIDEARGRLLGGTSSIHGMMYSRGNPADYDKWEALGLAGWAYRDVLPYFRKTETNWRGASEYHGGDGPLSVLSNDPHPVIFPAMLQAAKEMGYDEVDDFNGAQQEGVGMPDFMVQKTGRRDSSATAFLDRKKPRGNLTVVTGALVGRILLDGTRAIGVEYRRKGKVVRSQSDEVIVAAGAFGSPQLLQLSGIGNAEALRKVGVRPRHNLDAVGQNLQDHPLIHAVFHGVHGLRLDKMLRLDRLAIGWARWMLKRPSYLSDHPMSLQGFVRTESESTRPDTLFQVVHVPFLARPWLPGETAPGDQFMGSGLQLHPVGRGSVGLRSNNPTAAPVIRGNLFKEEADKQAARNILGFIMDFFASDSLRGIVGDTIRPVLDLDDTSAVDSYLSQTIGTGKHPIGTCAMGVDTASSVVDEELKVHGIDGLRVIDGSVMPSHISGNTDAPIKMIAEKGADLIKQVRQPTSSVLQNKK